MPKIELVNSMSQDSKKLKVLVNLKKETEKRINNLKIEIKEATELLDILNWILIEKGFKRGDTKDIKRSKDKAIPSTQISFIEEKQSKPRFLQSESVIPLKTKDDVPLAIIYANKEALHVLPDESKKFNVNTPPFYPFLVERVLEKMREKDGELVRIGDLTLEKMFNYDIISENDLIREIVIRNVSEDRLRELKSSIRWTFEKMFEKITS